MKPHKEQKARNFWIAIGVLFVVANVWAFFHEDPIEIHDLKWSHKADHSIVEFTVENTTSSKKKASLVILSQWSSKTQNRTRPSINQSMEFEIELYPSELRKMKEILNYDKGKDFQGSTIVIEAVELPFLRNVKEI